MASLSIRITAPLAALLALSACDADRSHFPSLAIRPAERAYGTAQPVAPTASLPLTTHSPAGADLAAGVAALRDTARAAEALANLALVPAELRGAPAYRALAYRAIVPALTHADAVARAHAEGVTW